MMFGVRHYHLLLAALFALGAGDVRAIEVPGVGYEGQGADAVFIDLDGNPRRDVIFVAYDSPAGPNSFRYRVGLNLDAAGNAATWLPGFVQVAGVGDEGQGAGAAVAQLDADPRPDLILMAYDNPAGANDFRYRVAFNLDAGGRPARVGDVIAVAGAGNEGQGAAAIIGRIDADPRPDMILAVYDNPQNANNFRYRVGFNLDASGRAARWGNIVQTDGVGYEGQGLGAALVGLDADPRPEIILMAYDNPANANTFRYRTGYNLDVNGNPQRWDAGYRTFPGAGYEGQGAGLATANLDGDPRLEWLVMAYDNPANANSFRYLVYGNRSQPLPGGAAPPAIGLRKSIDALSVAELRSLRRGIAVMMARNTAARDSADFRRSWLFWANMHAHYGAGCQVRPPPAGVGSFIASNPAEMATWCRCQHGTPTFLTWHRMYVYFFERVLRQAAGDPALRLPYWDYATQPFLPAAYRDATYVNDAGATVPNPLRVTARDPGINAGTAALNPAIRTATAALAATTFAGFQTPLEGTPHGNVHVAIGGATGLMTEVPRAALDPIFWAHHSNIDRLYECWLRVGETARLPSDPAQLNTNYSFIDADGTTQTRRVGDMLRASALGYGYTSGAECPGGSAGAMQQMSTMAETPVPPPQSFPARGATRLNRGVTSVPIDVDRALRSNLESVAPAAARSILIIEGARVDAEPAALYNVYLSGRRGERVQIGVMSFFGAAGHGDHAEHGASAGLRFEFDATEALARLKVGTSTRPTLVFEPSTGLTNSTVAEATRRISPEANVRFDSVRIELRP